MKFIKDLGLKLPAKTFSDNPRMRKHCLLECDCGTQWEALTENYNGGRITMCRLCKNKLIGSIQNKGKGYTNKKPSRIRAVYNNMIDRCYKQNKKAYKDYGAVGVTVCDEWLDKDTGFISFREWSESNGYADNLVCDKDYLCEKLGISPKIYSPSTCTWMTPEENGALTSRLSQKEQSVLVEKYLNNSTVRELSIEYNYTYEGIVYILKKHNVYKKQNK